MREGAREEVRKDMGVEGGEGTEPTWRVYSKHLTLPLSLHLLCIATTGNIYYKYRHRLVTVNNIG